MLKRIIIATFVLLASSASASPWRKQSSTSNPIQWLMVSSTDHLTAATGLTVTATCSKNGGAFGACSGAVSEVGNGIYSLAGNATDRGTLGTLVIRATSAGADTAYLAVEIVGIDPFATDFGLVLSSSTVGTVTTVTNMVTANVTQISGDSAAADNLETATDGGSYNVGGGAIVSASVTGAVGSVTGNVGGNVAGSVGSVTGNVGGNVTGSVGSVAADGITASSIAADAIGASELAANAITSSEFAQTAGDVVWSSATRSLTDKAGFGLSSAALDAIWDEPTPHNTASTMGALLTAAGAAGDPWSTAVPGAYAAGTAGYYQGLLDDIQTSASLITAATVTIRTPVSLDGTIEIVKGDSYTNAEGTALPFAVGSKPWPTDLTSYTITITVDDATGTTLLTDTLSITTATGSSRAVRWEPTASKTAVAAGRYKYEIKATKGSEVKRLEVGVITIREGTT